MHIYIIFYTAYIRVCTQYLPWLAVDGRLTKSNHHHLWQQGNQTFELVSFSAWVLDVKYQIALVDQPVKHPGFPASASKHSGLLISWSSVGLTERIWQHRSELTAAWHLHHHIQIASIGSWYNALVSDRAINLLSNTTIREVRARLHIPTKIEPVYPEHLHPCRSKE